MTTLVYVRTDREISGALLNGAVNQRNNGIKMIRNFVVLSLVKLGGISAIIEFCARGFTHREDWKCLT